MSSYFVTWLLFVNRSLRSRLRIRPSDLASGTPDTTLTSRCRARPVTQSMPPGRSAHLQRRLQPDVHQRIGSRALLDALQQDFRRLKTDIICGLHNGRDGRRKQVVYRQLVEGHERDVLRSAQPAVAKRAQDAKSSGAVGGEDRVWQQFPVAQTLSADSGDVFGAQISRPD